MTDLWILPERKQKYSKDKTKHKPHLHKSEHSDLLNSTVMLNLIQNGGRSVKLLYETLHICMLRYIKKAFN